MAIVEKEQQTRMKLKFSKILNLEVSCQKKERIEYINTYELDQKEVDDIEYTMNTEKKKMKHHILYPNNLVNAIFS